MSAVGDCSKLDIELAAVEAWRLKFQVQLELCLIRIESIHFRRLGLV